MHGETAVSDVRCAATAGISHYVSDGSELRTNDKSVL